MGETISSLAELLDYINGRKFIQIHYREYGVDQVQQTSRPNLGVVKVVGETISFTFQDKVEMVNTTTVYELTKWSNFVNRRTGAIVFRLEFGHRGFTSSIVWYEA